MKDGSSSFTSCPLLFIDLCAHSLRAYLRFVCWALYLMMRFDPPQVTVHMGRIFVTSPPPKISTATPEQTNKHVTCETNHPGNKKDQENSEE